MKTKLITTAISVTIAVTAGCGGGGSTNVSTPVTNTGGNTTNTGANITNTGGSTPNSGTLTLEGTVATGAALAGASINAKCAVGSGATASAANGTYSISIAGGLLPCAIRASSNDAKTVLHSAIEGTGDGKVVANITTFSELIVAQTHGQSASDLFDQFANTQSKLTTAALVDAKAKVSQALSSIVDLTNVDPIKDTLVAATASTAGNSLDKKLDALRDKLAAAELTSNDLSNLLTANAGGSIGEVVKVALQPQSTVCPGFRSGDYLYIDPSGSVPVQSQTFNAKTLKLGSEQYSSPNCYLATANGPKAAFGAQSIGIGLTAQNTLAVLLPKQNLALTDLTGTWNYVQRSRVTGTNNYKVSWGEIVVAADGKASAEKFCDSIGCTTVTATNLTSFSAAAEGAFVAKDGMRAFGYRAATGAMSMIGIDKANGDTGRLFVARKGPAAALPAISDSLNNFDLSITSNGQVDSIINLKAYSITPASISTAFIRTRLADCQIETLAIGKPFLQMFERTPGTTPGCIQGSATTPLTDLKILPGTGLGFSASVSASNNELNLVVTRD
jgi:hypothetical protein